MFHCVSAVGYTEAEFKVEALQQLVFEVMLFYHSELVYRLITNNKFYAARKNCSSCLTLHHKIVFILGPIADINSLPNGEILDRSKLKAFADDKLDVVKMMISLFDTFENTVGKGLYGNHVQATQI